jgi:hypothetical protein
LEDPSDQVFLALRSAVNHTNLRVSLHTRVALALALIYLIIGQPEVGKAIGVIGLGSARVRDNPDELAYFVGCGSFPVALSES